MIWVAKKNIFLTHPPYLRPIVTKCTKNFLLECLNFSEPQNSYQNRDFAR